MMDDDLVHCPFHSTTNAFVRLGDAVNVTRPSTQSGSAANSRNNREMRDRYLKLLSVN